MHYETITFWEETKLRQPCNILTLASNLSLSHPSPQCNSRLFKSKHKNVWMKFFLRSRPSSLSLHPLQGATKSAGQCRVIYFISFNLPHRVLICPGDQFLLDFKKIYLPVKCSNLYHRTEITFLKPQGKTLHC